MKKTYDLLNHHRRQIMNTDFTSILDNLAEVDWKGESQDVLYAVRESYKVSYPALSGKILDELMGEKTLFI